MPQSVHAKMDSTYSIWQVSPSQMSAKTTSAVSGDAGEVNRKIVNFDTPCSSAQVIERVATPNGDGITRFGSGTNSVTYHRHPGVTIMNEPILLQIPEQRQYLVDESSIQNIDQMPPANLIMGATDACEGSAMVSTSNGGQVFHLTSDPATDEITINEYDSGCGRIQSADSSCEQTQYTEECEVMEEVITDDWVQSQGEECVQVTVDQLGANTVVGTVEEDDISVPLDQDEYTLSRPFPCDFCSRRFRKKANLLNHLVAHSNDRPYVCKLCGAQYGRRIDLTNHFKQHAYAANNQYDATLRSDHEVDYDMTGLPMSHHKNPRSQQSSEDEDMFNEGTRAVSYNSQPPMQLISSSNSATTSAYIDDSAGAVQGSNDSAGTTVTMNSILKDGSYYFIPPSGQSKRNSSRRAHQTSAAESVQHQPKRQIPKAGKSGFTQGKRNNTANRYSSKESRGTTAELHPGPSGSAIAPQNYPVINEKKPFVCQQCGASFGREKALASHSRVHGGDMQYRCPTCDARFWDRSLLQDHIRQRHPNLYPQYSADHSRSKQGTKMHAVSAIVKSFVVKEAGSTNDDRNGMEPTDGQHICDICHKVFDRSEHVKKHMQEAHSTPLASVTPSDHLIVKQEHMGEILFAERGEPEEDEHGESNDEGLECSMEYDVDSQDQTLCCRDCGKTFANNTELMAHSKKVHPRIKPHECQLCGVKFPNESIIQQHVQESHRYELTETSCAICGKPCKSQNSLMKHSLDHSRERAHCCPKCGKTFHHMGRLKRHMESHRNKTVRCEVCGEEFPDGRTLMNHRHSHSKSNNYPCEECGKTFGSRSSQQIHLRIHTGERPYACRFCWKAFADGGTLRKHERVHTGEKPYGCSVCPKEFNQRVVLREHIRAHHSQPDAIRGSAELPYYCSVCSSLFATAADLVQDLIEHSDSNTAKKRKPPTFPRKYKRRRKLKPLELERLQSGRRKQKVTSTATKADDSYRETEENEDSEDDEEQYEPTVSLEREDGTLKTSSELFFEYAGPKIQTLAVASSKFISPYELLGEATAAKDQSHTLKVGESMLDDNGINLLSNVVVMQGQEGNSRGLGKLNSNHHSESPNKRKSARCATGATTRAKDPSGISGSRVTRTQANKRAPASKANQVAKGSKKRAKTGNSSKDILSVTSPDGECPIHPSGGVSSVSNAMEAISELERKRSRTGHMPSYVREIPSDRISENFPLLDDGNVDDTMEESMESASDDRGTRRHYSRQRYISSTSSVTRDDEDEQLLLEISRREKYTDRFNSDIVNDLAEILRSPLKGTSAGTTSVPPMDILGSPNTRHAVLFPSITKQDRFVPKIEATIDKRKDQKSVTKTGRAGTNKSQPKSKIKSHDNSKPRAAASGSSVDASSSSGTLDAYPTTLQYSHGRRLTRRQLEREVNFLSEAFRSQVSNPAPSNVTSVPTSTTVSTFPIGEGRCVVIKQEQVNASEQLAEMLLSDGMPVDSGSGIASASGQPEVGHFNGECEIASGPSPTIHKKLEPQDGNSGETHETATDKHGNTLQTTSTSDADCYRCSICAACFQDRSQLILHVPVHM